MAVISASLAGEIYVAESNEKGGTWYGVVDGLKKGRNIYARKPEENEKNANEKLIGMSAVPVDFNGKTLDGYTPKSMQASFSSLANEPFDKPSGKTGKQKARGYPKQKGLFDE